MFTRTGSSLTEFKAEQVIFIPVLNLVSNNKQFADRSLIFRSFNATLIPHVFSLFLRENQAKDHTSNKHNLRYVTHALSFCLCFIKMAWNFSKHGVSVLCLYIYQRNISMLLMLLKASVFFPLHIKY